MPKLPDCSAGDCDRDAFLLHRDLPWCAAHFEAAGGVL
jgi:hypothetical protein